MIRTTDVCACHQWSMATVGVRKSLKQRFSMNDERVPVLGKVRLQEWNHGRSLIGSDFCLRRISNYRVNLKLLVGNFTLVAIHFDLGAEREQGVDGYPRIFDRFAQVNEVVGVQGSKFELRFRLL